MTEWFTAGELAAERLPGLPSSEGGMAKYIVSRNWRRAEYEGLHWRQRDRRGGGVEYKLSVLPVAARLVVIRRHTLLSEWKGPLVGDRIEDGDDLWSRWRRQTAAAQRNGAKKAMIMRRLDRFCATGVNVSAAIREVALVEGIPVGTLWRWRAKCDAFQPQDWDAVLTMVTESNGRPRTPIDDRAFAMLQELWAESERIYREQWVRPNAWSMSACLRRMRAKAREEGWMIPSDRTLMRRIGAMQKTKRAVS